jgi:hypothetical protein
MLGTVKSTGGKALIVLHHVRFTSGPGGENEVITGPRSSFRTYLTAGAGEPAGCFFSEAF